MSGNHETYSLFWNGFLLEFHSRYPDWEAKRRGRHWISCPSSKPGVLRYSGSWSREPTRHLKAEGYIEKECNKKVFKVLREQREELEKMVGDQLKWNIKPCRQKTSIELWFPSSIEIAEEDRWPEAKQWLLDALGRMRGALDPALDRLSI